MQASLVAAGRVVVVHFILLSTMLVETQCIAADWPLVRGDAAGTGRAEGTLPADPQILWEHSVGGAGFEGTPIIAGGAVYCADVDGRVLCLDLSKGNVRWEQKLDTGFIAGGAVRDGRFFIGDYDGVVHAFSTADGKEQWTFKTEAQIDSGANFYGDNLLITSEDGVLYCLTQSAGELNWKYETGDQLRCSPSLAGNKTFLGGCDGKLHIVDVEKGVRVQEPLPLESPTGSTPTVLGETVFVPTHSGDIFAFDSATGMQLWHFKDPKLAQEFQNSVAVAEGLVIASSHNRRVFALDLKTGEKRWDVPVRKRADSSPITVGNRVIVTATDGRLIILELSSGRDLGVREVKGGFIASAAYSDGRIVAVSDKGTIYCFGAK